MTLFGFSFFFFFKMCLWSLCCTFICHMIIFSAFIKTKGINIELLTIESMSCFDEQVNFLHSVHYP